MLIISTDCGIVVVKLKPLNVAGVEGLLNGEASPAIAITGNIGNGNGYGFARRGNALYGDSRGVAGIYQKRYTGYNQHGYIPGKKRAPYYVRMRFYRPTNPRTVAQQANRTKFQEAVENWQAMDDAQRAPYKARASRKGRRGRNLYIQEYMLNSDT